jgi:hypothetical protein
MLPIFLIYTPWFLDLGIAHGKSFMFFDVLLAIFYKQ